MASITNTTSDTITQLLEEARKGYAEVSAGVRSGRIKPGKHYRNARKSRIASQTPYLGKRALSSESQPKKFPALVVRPSATS